ncbi:MAG: PAS domain S-box protein [Anaerolineales bacterium]
MEQKPVHILIVDDDPSLRTTLHDILLAKGFAPVQAATGSAALARAAEQDIDVALIDLQLEDISGLDLLRALKTNSPGSECILLTGHASQGSAIEAINAGAYAYFQKPCDVDQLVLSIQRAGEKKAAEETLQESEERFRKVFDNGPMGMALSDKSYRFVQANPSFCQMLGYSEQELTSLSFKDITHPDDLGDSVEKVQELERGEIPIYKTEKRYISKNKAVIWGSLTLSKITDSEGKILFYLVMIENITERRQAEDARQQSETLFRSLFDLSPDAVVLIDPHNRKIAWPIIDCNAAACAMNGYRRDELIGQSIDILDEKPESEAERSAFIRRLRKAGIIKREFHHRHKNGSIFPIEVSSTLIQIGGRELLIGIDRDITERRQAEEALRESEERFRVIFEKANDGINFTNANDELIAVNSRMCEMLGYSRDELLKMRVRDLQAPEVRASGDVLKNELALHGNALFEGLDLHRSGRRIPVEISIGQMTLPSGEFYVSIVRDITERKQAEAELHESQRRLATLMGNLPGLAYRCKNDPDWTMEFISQGCYPLTGYQPADLIDNLRLSYAQMIHPDDRQMVWDLIQAEIEKKQPYQLEYRIITSNGKEKWVWEQGQGVYGTGGDLLALEGFVTDITERKQAEAELHASEERYRMLAENTTDTVSLMDLNLRTTYISPSVTRLRGYRLDDLNTIPLDQQMKPESFLRFVKFFNTELAPERLAQADLHISGTLELEYTKQDGSTFWSETTFSLIRASRGQPLAILASGRDISERKKTQATLELSEKRFRALIENNTDAIVLIDPRGRVLYESPAYGKITGRFTGERIGRSSFEYLHPDDRGDVAGILNEFIQNPIGIRSATFRLQHKDGSWRWLEATATNLLGETAVNAIVLNLHDVTERKKAEETLITTERIYRQAITRTGGVPYQRNYDSDAYAFLGEGIESLTGYPPTEMTGSLFNTRLRQVQSFGEHADIPHEEHIRLARQGKEIKEWREDYLFERKDGSLVWLADHAVQIKDADENPTGSLGILMDITERKRAEENIRQRVNELEVLYETGLSINRLLDPKEIGQKVIETLAEKLSWRHASVRLYHPETQRLELLVFNRPGLSKAELQAEIHRLNKIIKPGEGFSGWVVQHGQSIRNGNVGTDARFLRTFKGIQSGLYVPMLVGDHAVGVIGVESEQADAFSEDDERLLKTLAAQASIAIENARLLEEVLHQVEELGALTDVSSAMRSAQDRSEIISAILDQLMMGLFHTDDASLVAYDPSTGSNRIEAARGEWEKKIGLHLEPGEGLSGLLAETLQPYQSNNIHQEERLTKVEFSDGDEALAGVPLLVQGQFIGSLWIGRTGKSEAESPQPFTSDEMQLLTSIADLAANALQRAAMHDQALRHAEELLAINSMGRVLAETLDLDQIYTKLDQVVWQLLDNISLVAIALYDADKKQFICAWIRNDKENLDAASLPPAPLEPPGAGTQSEAVHTRQPVIINDLREQLKQVSFKMDVGSGDGMNSQSGLYVPMLVHGRVIGVMQAQSTTLNRFSQADADLLSLVANTAAVDIENARLFSETQKRLRNLAALHAIDTAISASVDIHVTLDVLLEQTVSGLNVDAAAVLLLNPLGRSLEYAASRGFRAHQLNGMHIPLGAGLAGQTALQRQIQSASGLQDGTASPEGHKPAFNIYDGEGFVAEHAVPLLIKGQVHGVLEVFKRSPFQPDDEWFTFLETLSRQAAIAIDNANLFDDLQRSKTNIVLAYDATIQGWSQALELRDKETEGHAQRVTERTVQLAQILGVPDAELEHVRRGTLLHDIGKMGIPDSILLKPGKLTKEEWMIMRQHPVMAYQMLSSIAYLRPALDIPHYHHEKWDGSGYPEGLKGEQIPLYARIFAIVDVYDALTNDRPYKSAWTKEKTIEYIRAESGKHFDPGVVEAFLNMLARGN